MDSAHEAAALAVEVLYRVSVGWLGQKVAFFLCGGMLAYTIDFLLEGGFVHVSGSCSSSTLVPVAG